MFLPTSKTYGNVLVIYGEIVSFEVTFFNFLKVVGLKNIKKKALDLYIGVT